MTSLPLKSSSKSLLLLSLLAALGSCREGALHQSTDGPPGVIKCSTEADCPVYWKCIVGRCEKPAACNDRSQCLCGKICREGLCVECTADNQCDTETREACLSGSCLRPDACCSDTDCRAGYRCKDAEAGKTGRCEWVVQQPDAGLCSPACDAGVCRNGQCVDPNACSEEYRCPPGYECLNGLCVQVPEGCASDQQCGLFCCDTDAGACVDCQVRCSEGYVWDPESHGCILEEKSCLSSDECGEGNFCYERVHKCRPNGGDGFSCESDSECIAGYRCHKPVANVCRKICSSDDDCEYEGYYCDTLRRICMPGGS